MSFLFRRSTEQPRVNEEETNKEIKDESQQQQQEKEDDNSKQEELLSDSVNEKPKEQPKPVKRRGTFFGNLLGNGSKNSSSASLNSSHSSVSSSSKFPPLGPLTLTGYKESTHHRLLDSELANNIRNLIPARFQLFDNWELVYSLEQHGISLNTLYRNSNPEHQLRLLKKQKAAEKGFADSIVKNMVVGDTSRPRYSFEPKRSQSYVLVIKDNHNNKFGAYLSENLKPMEHRRYYGNGECFLWKCEKYDPSKLDHAVDKRATQEIRFKAFMYTGINDNIVYSNHDFIAIGSSNGQNGLFIDKSLLLGVSYSCDTFGNEILNSSPQNAKFGSFKIKGLEVWRIGTLE